MHVCDMRGVAISAYSDFGILQFQHTSSSNAFRFQQNSMQNR
jgi:hypothetical protein